MRSMTAAIPFLVALTAPLAAQDSTITVEAPGPKSAVIDRVVDAMSRAGLIVTDVSEGGLVVGKGRSGDDWTYYYAAIRGTDPITITLSATHGIYIKGYADVPAMRITSARRECWSS
jgi:hypothetical protein